MITVMVRLGANDNMVVLEVSSFVGAPTTKAAVNRDSKTRSLAPVRFGIGEDGRYFLWTTGGYIKR